MKGNGSADALDRQGELVDRCAGARRAILDRAADNPRGGGQPDGFRYRGRIVSEAVLEIGAHRQVDCRCDVRQMPKHPVAAHREVALPDGKRVARARGGQRLEAQVRQQPGRSDVPGIGDDERVVQLVECPEGAPLLGLSLHVEILLL